MKITRIGELPIFKHHVWRGTQAPTPIVRGDLIEMAFSARDDRNRSYKFAYMLDINNPLQVVRENVGLTYRPSGKAGAFDSDGFMISQFFVDQQSREYIYFAGWENVQSKEVKYRTSCGSAFNGEVIQAPIIDRTILAPCGSSMPFRAGTEIFYQAIDKWEDGECFYNIASYCKTEQGFFIHKPILNRLEGEGGLARPVVIDHKHLMFSARGDRDFRTSSNESYRLWIANRRGDDWVRQEKPIRIENDNSFMNAYGYPLKVKDKWYLFYNSHFCSPIQVAIMEF